MPRTHEKVSDPRDGEERRACLGPEGSVARVRANLAALTGRWKLDILFQLFARPAEAPTMRFSELERAITGVSQKMLAVRLRELEKDGVVCRVVHPEVPPRVEYALTPLGAELRPALALLRNWRA